MFRVTFLRVIALRVVAIALCVAASGVARADDILGAIDGALKAYQGGDLSTAKQQLDLASQLVGRKNAEAFAALLPQPLSGWQGDKPYTTAVGALGFGASQASRTYTNARGDSVEVQITGDSALIAQISTFLASPSIAGAMGKIGRVGALRAIVSTEGDLHMVVGNKFLILVQGRASAADKLSYAQAVDVARLGRL